MALGCLARDFLPSSVTFSWNYKNSSKVSSQNIQDFPSVLRGGKYLASSRVLLPSVSIPRTQRPSWCARSSTPVAPSPCPSLGQS